MPTLLQQQLYFAWIKQVISGTTFPQKSRIQSLRPILDLDNLYSLPFDDCFFALCPLPKLLLLSWTSLFCLSRSSSCWCILTRRFDIHLCVSSGRSLAFPWCMPTDVVCAWSISTISSALATSCFSWNYCISCKDIFLTRSTQPSPVQLYSTVCDFPEGQSICSYSYSIEFIIIPNHYNTMKEF